MTAAFVTINCFLAQDHLHLLVRLAHLFEKTESILAIVLMQYPCKQQAGFYEIISRCLQYSWH